PLPLSRPPHPPPRERGPGWGILAVLPLLPGRGMGWSGEEGRGDEGLRGRPRHHPSDRHPRKAWCLEAQLVPTASTAARARAALSFSTSTGFTRCSRNPASL